MHLYALCPVFAKKKKKKKFCCKVNPSKRDIQLCYKATAKNNPSKRQN